MKTLVTCLSLLAIVSPHARAETKKMWAQSILGQKAPELVVESWLGDKPETKGKFVLIDFWATWCGPCRKAIPELNGFHRKYRDQLVVIGISDEPAQKVKAFASPKIEYFSAIDSKARMKDALAVKGIPHVIIINPEGIVVWEGFPFLSGFELTDEVVARLIAADRKPEKSAGFDLTVKLQGITFRVQSPNKSAENTLTITPTGLELQNEIITSQIDGTVTGAEVADLNSDGSPEIYVYVTSAGSGSYGSLAAYSANNKKSLTAIYLPPITEDKVNSKGYMGHDEFTVVENTLARRFPIYKDGDPNSSPSGGTRQLAYQLIQGEAGWILKLKKSSDF